MYIISITFQRFVTVSPSQKWEDHYKQIIDGTKFLNIVGNENVTDERVLGKGY